MLGVYGDDELDSFMARDIPAGQRHVRVRDITPDKPRYPANQRATVIPIDFMGNLVCGNASLQVVFHS